MIDELDIELPKQNLYSNIRKVPFKIKKKIKIKNIISNIYI